jgi:hypothetical protein
MLRQSHGQRGASTSRSADEEQVRFAAINVVHLPDREFRYADSSPGLDDYGSPSSAARSEAIPDRKM